VISVAAVNSANSRAYYSNYGSWVRVAAPGGDSTDRDGDGFPDAVFSTHASRQSGAIVNTYDFLIGTSMAAPHVAGVIALMKAINPTLTPAGIDSLLASGLMTRDIGFPGPDELGVGLIDAFKSAQAASNTPPPLLPQLGLSPRSLNFGDVGTEAEVLVSNTGGGALAITSILKVAGWLQVIADQVDATGLGTYRIVVDRVGRTPGTYSSFVEFRSTAGDQRVDILMQVTTSPNVANAGRQYVVLVDESTSQVTQQVAVLARGESVDFSFSNVTPISYQLLVGSDMNNDGTICDDGEACGAYPVFGEPTVVRPTAADLAFETAFRTYGQAAANSLGVGLKKP
jgi:serine protease